MNTARPSTFYAEVWAVFIKDVRSEVRTRAALATILLFAVVTLIVLNICAGKVEGAGLTQLGLIENYVQAIRDDPKALILRTLPHGTLLRSQLLSALFWVVLFFSAMAGLPRTFVKEEENRTAAALRLSARPAAVYGGKLLFNACLTVGIAIVIVPLFLILFEPWVADWPSFSLHVLVGTLAMAGGATLLGAIVSRAGGRAYLMLPLAFPILLPVLICAINGTATALYGKGGNQLVALVSYTVAMGTVSALLFEKVWTDA
jgi:heme exporter protein B